MKKIILTNILVIFFIAFSSEICFAQKSEQTVTITSTAAGANQPDAKQAALRDALEQAFGAFITTKTEIINDKIVNDEITSVANGNIQDYSVLSEQQITDGRWLVTLKVVVAVDKLISYAQSKGMEVSFKGGLFALNIKQQILNEKGEVRAIENMVKTLNEIADHSFNYSITSGVPVTAISIYGENEPIWGMTKPKFPTKQIKDYWCIPIKVNVYLNENFKNIANVLTATLRGLDIGEQGANEYKQMGKEVEDVYIKKDTSSSFQVFHLRSYKSVYLIYRFIGGLKYKIENFNIDDGNKSRPYSEISYVPEYYGELVMNNVTHDLEQRQRASPCGETNYVKFNKFEPVQGPFSYFISPIGSSCTFLNSYYHAKEVQLNDEKYQQAIKEYVRKFYGYTPDYSKIPIRHSPYEEIKIPQIHGYILKFDDLCNADGLAVTYEYEDCRTLEEISKIAKFSISNPNSNKAYKTESTQTGENQTVVSMSNDDKKNINNPISKKGMLGIKIIELNEKIIDEINQNNKNKGRPFSKDQKGIFINEVIADGAAANAGLKIGDVILTFNGEDDFTTSFHFEKMKDLVAGDEVSLKVLKWQGGIEIVKVKLK